MLVHGMWLTAAPVLHCNALALTPGLLTRISEASLL